MSKKSFVFPQLTVVVAVLFLGILGYFIYKNRSPKIESLNFEVGNFTFNTNTNYIYKDPKRSDWQASVSNLKNFGQWRGNCGESVSNISTLFLEKKMSNAQDQRFASRISLKSWNSDNLIFLDDKTKTSFLGFENQLKNLKNRSGVLSSLDRPFSSLDLFLSCGGYYSVPILVEKIDSSKFDTVYYLEVLEGNGSIHSPVKKLVIYNRRNWLIFSEDTSISTEDYDKYSDCYKNNNNISDSGLKCVVKKWRDQYRNQDEATKWINQSLSSLKFRD